MPAPVRWLLVGWVASACGSSPRPPGPAPRPPVITEDPAPLPPPPGTRFVVHGDGWRVLPLGARLFAVGRERFVTLTSRAATLWDPRVGRVAGVGGRSPAVVVAEACESEHGCREAPLVTPDGAWVLTRGDPPGSDRTMQVAQRLDPEPVPGWRDAWVVQEVRDGGCGPGRFLSLLHLGWDDRTLRILDERSLDAPESCTDPYGAWWAPGGTSVVCERADGWVWAWPGGEVIAHLPAPVVHAGFSVDGRVLSAFDGRSEAVVDVIDGLRFVRSGWAVPVGAGALLVGDAWIDARDGAVLAPTAPNAVAWLFHPDGTVFPGGPPCVGERGPAPCPTLSAADLGFEFPLDGPLEGRGWSLDVLPDGSVAVLATPAPP